MLVLTSSEHKSTIEVDGIVISFGVISHKFWPNDDDDPQGYFSSSCGEHGLNVCTKIQELF